MRPILSRRKDTPQLTRRTQALLLDLKANAGSLDIYEPEFDNLSWEIAEARAMNLVRTSVSGWNGWGTITLTKAGRKHVGLPALPTLTDRARALLSRWIKQPS